MNRVPTPAQFANYGSNQAAILESIRREITSEIEGLLSGEITTDKRGRVYHLRNARRRLERLEKLARDSRI